MGGIARFLRGKSVGHVGVLVLEEYLGPIFRIIPGFEGFFLRWLFLKLACAKMGRMGNIYTGVRIVHAYGLTVGDKVNINHGTYIDGRGGVEIGDFVLMGPGVKIITSNHQIDHISGPITDQPCQLKEVKIEEDVWLGAGAIVLPGVTIGRGGVVAAGSVVTEDIPPFSIVGGAPAREIRKRRGDFAVG